MYSKTLIKIFYEIYILCIGYNFFYYCHVLSTCESLLAISLNGFISISLKKLLLLHYFRIVKKIFFSINKFE